MLNRDHDLAGKTGSPETMDDRFMIYNDLTSLLYDYARISKAYQKQPPENPEAVTITREETIAYYKQFELFSHILCFKGIEAFKQGDPVLAMQLFVDAIESTPEKVRYIDPYVYLLAVQLFITPAEASRTIEALYEKGVPTDTEIKALVFNLGTDEDFKKVGEDIVRYLETYDEAAKKS